MLSFSLSAPLLAQASQPDDLAPPDLRIAPESVPRGEGGTRILPDGEIPSARSTARAVPLADAAPESITSFDVVEVRSTDARLAWVAPASGSPITGYALQLLQNGTVIDDAVWDVPENSAYISGLDPETEYGFRVAAINAVGRGPFSGTQLFRTTRSSVERQYGADRYETAVQVSQSAFPYEGVNTAFVASGRNFPDALAAAAAAGALGGPVLLTQPGSVGQSTIDEIDALNPEYLIVAGGTGVVSNTVYNELAAYATVDRYRAAGQNRYDTAGLISTLWDSTGVVYLASGTDYPDALAGAAAASGEGAPVLLATRDRLPAETAAALKYHAPSKLVVLGGSGALSEKVVSQAKAAAGGSVVLTYRLFGSSRYDTAVEISRVTFSPRVLVVYIASGMSFADALAGAAAAGNLGGPVLLTMPTSISPATIAEIKRLDPVRVVVLGGPSVVTDAVYQQIEDALR